jgi:class 3 adenylate cyclase
MFSLTDVHSALLPAMLVEPLELGIDRGSLHGAVLMVDITGFTPLTVALTQEGPEGAETLSEMLRAAFTPLVSTVRSCGGSITGFAGDSFIAIFPDEHGAHEAAERTASQALPSHTTRAGTHHSLSVRVTLAAGPVRWGIASGAHQSTWFMRGTAIDHAARLQDAAIPGRLLHEPGLAPRPTRPSVWPSPERSALQAGRTQPAAVHGRLGRPEFREVVSVFLRLEPDLDDAAVVAVLTQVMDRTHAHRGYFNRADFGDKGSVCLLLFGAPLAFEDDVHNALCAVLSIRAAVAEHTRLAVGIARGRCFAGLVGSAQRAEYTALGPTTNLAARLMSAASWGEIRVATPLDAHPNHTFDPLPPSPYKGFANPILAARWTGRTEDRTAQDPERPVGRDQETLRIVRFIDHAAQHRRGGLCRVDGAPGMGKSLLVQAARAAVGADVLWLDGSADGQRMFLPFAHMVADADPSSLPERLQTALRWLKGDLDRSHPFHNGEPLVRFEQAQRALLALLVGAATGRTAVFAIDDAHLLDAGSAALLKRLLGAARAEPWVVLTAARPDDAGKPAVLPSVAGTRSDRQELGPLPPKALRLLMAALLGGNPTLHAAEQLHIQTQGNPLFAKQLLLFQRDTGTALPDATADIHRWRLSTAGSHVPTALRQLLVARLDRLELSLKEAAQAAAVVGHTFRTSLLATVIGRPVQGAVARGRRHDLWVHLSEDQHRFCSALLGDAAYALLPTRARLGLHRSAADALLAAHPGNAPGAHHRAICHHLRAAGDTEREQVHARLALVWATDRYANAEALDLTSRLLELAASDATERADLHLQRVT